MSDTERQLVTAGFAKCPNIKGRWYGVTGALEPPFPLALFARADGLALAVQPYGKHEYIDVFRFGDSVKDLIHFLLRHGQPAPPGQHGN
jgi:hypothetical protein